jgi:hypothetical protein
MFSECSDKSQVPSFMEHVIDPQPHGDIGSFGKVDFLQARTFLKVVKFSHQPALDELIDQLAIMFSAHYETKPDAREQQHATKMLQHLIRDPSFIDIYKASRPYQYDMWMTLLASPTATISLFDHVLHDCLQWPFNDHAVKQHIFAKTPSPQQVIKTGWSTTWVMGGICKGTSVHFLTSPLLISTLSYPPGPHVHSPTLGTIARCQTLKAEHLLSSTSPFPPLLLPLKLRTHRGRIGTGPHDTTAPSAITWMPS